MLLNGNEIKTGDTVKVANAYCKSHNGLYFVEHSKGDAGWCGNDYCLHRICKNGKLSIADNNINFWPLCTYVSSREKSIAADKWNKENATIEKVEGIDKTYIIEYFKNETMQMQEHLKHHIWNYGEESETVKETQLVINFYNSVIAKIKSEQTATIAENATVQKLTETKPKETTITNSIGNIYIHNDGDIDLSIKGYNNHFDEYEYDAFTNRYYHLEDGALSSEDGALVKKRISKKAFETLYQSVANANNEIEEKQPKAQPETYPILTAENAKIGNKYAFAGGYQILTKLYNAAPEQAKQEQLIYIGRAETIDNNGNVLNFGLSEKPFKTSPQPPKE